MKQYPTYKTTAIGWVKEIPLEWGYIKFKYVAIIETGCTPPMADKSNYENGDVLFVKPDELDGFNPIIDSKEKITKSALIRARLIPNNSLLTCAIGTIGKFGIAGSDLTTNQQINSFTFNQKKIDPKYGIYSFIASIEEQWRNSTTNVVAIINKTSQSRIALPYPSRDEQTQIVKYLDFKTDLIDGFISNRQKQIDLLKEQLRKKIYTALTKGLANKDFKPSDLPWFTEIPVNWEMYKFNAAIKLLHGFQFRDNHFKEQGVKVAKITQLNADGSLDLSEASLVDEKFLITLKKKIIKNGDILMALTGGTIGKIIQVENLDEEVLQNYRVGKFVPKDTRTLDKDFMFWVLSSEFTFAQILFLQRETGQPNIGIGDFSKMFFPMPNTLEEQREIAAYIVEQKNETNSLISKYQKQIDLMQEYRTAIISQAVTGKIDVRDWQPKTKEIIA